jgi:hypothetical protein
MFDHRSSLLRCCWVSVSFCLGLAFVAATFAQQPAEAKKYPHDVHFDFRGKPLPPELILTPAGSDRFVRSEPEGLRITLPKDRRDLSPVAVGTRSGIDGDFEITATLEILQADQPRDGFGVGATLFINKVEPIVEGAGIGRLLRADGSEVVYWDRGMGRTAEELQFDADFRPCADRQLRLRLKRTGAQLAYLLGSGLEGENFEELPPKEFGGSDIKQVLVRVSTGRQPCNVDVRLIDLRIRSGAAPATPIVAATPTMQLARGWLVAGLFVALLGTSVLAIVFGTLLFRSRRNGAEESNQ